MLVLGGAWLATFCRRRAGGAVSLVVTGGTVVTMDATGRVISPGAVAVDGTDIVAVGTPRPFARNSTRRRRSTRAARS